jgi:amidase
MAGADPIPGVIGPLSTSLYGIELFMKTIIDSKPWLLEPALIPLPWNPVRISPNQPLKIAVMWHDKVVTPHPPISRVLQEVASRLRLLPNVTVVDWKAHLHDEAWAIISSLYYTDGGVEDAAIIAESGEPWRPLTTWMIKENPCVKKLSPQKLYYWQEEREAYRKEYAKVWNETATGRNEHGELEGVADVILCPVGPGVAPAHNTAKYWGYTSQWNLLDYPAVVFPVSKVDKSKDGAAVGFKAMTDVDEENWKLCEFFCSISCQIADRPSIDNAEKFEGLPISLQLVGRRFEDAKVLAILDYIKDAIHLPLVAFP